MEWYVYVFAGVFLITSIAAVILALLKDLLQERIQDRYFNKDSLLEYEKSVQSYFNEANVQKTSDLNNLLKSLRIKLNECGEDDLPHNAEAEMVGDIININKDLNLRQKNFAIAHEIAHRVRGTSGARSVTRMLHSFLPRSMEEQICDYIAAAILLPREELSRRMIREKYYAKSKKERIRFINIIADEKNVSVNVVERRIKEIKIMGF